MLIRNHVEAHHTAAARLRGSHPSDRDIELVPALHVGASVPSRGVIPATRAEGAV
jgi:hypothetical protein